MPLENPRLSERVARQLLAMARESARPGARLPSERRLAAELGVSRSTVQEALALLSEQGLVRRLRGSGTYLTERPLEMRSGRREVGLVRVFAPGQGEEWRGIFYYREIFRGLANAARHKAVELEVATWSESAGASQVPPDPDVPAILLGLADARMISELVERDAPRPILVDHAFRDLPITCIVDGSFAGVRKGVARLGGLGHRRIAFLAQRGWEFLNPDKMKGYRAGLEDAGLRWDPELVVETEGAGDELTGAAERLLSLPEPPTAFFCHEDGRAVALVELLEERRLVVGRDVSVLGHGDTAFRTGRSKRLSSIRIPLRRMGERALEEALLAEPANEGKILILRNRLILRESVGKHESGADGEEV